MSDDLCLRYSSLFHAPFDPGVHQLQQALQQQGCSITKQEAAAVVRHFDSDNDSLLTFADFTRLMQTSCDSHSASSGAGSGALAARLSHTPAATDDETSRIAPRPFMAKAYMTNTSASSVKSALDPAAALRCVQGSSSCSHHQQGHLPADSAKRSVR